MHHVCGADEIKKTAKLQQRSHFMGVTLPVGPVIQVASIIEANACVSRGFFGVRRGRQQVMLARLSEDHRLRSE
jgi:hypothetical protein